MPRYLGQHFLKDVSVLERTVDVIKSLLPKDTEKPLLIEVGPGKGALTRYIHELSGNFVCMEKDMMMQLHLLQFLEPEQIIWGDVLEADVESVLRSGKQSSELSNDSKTEDSLTSHTNYLVVGNLPYYITSPIFRKFFVPDTQSSSELALPLGGVFLIQKEVADKIKTDAPKKSYLWWLMNNYYTVEYLFTVGPKAFSPPPKVDSAVIQFVRKDKPEVEDMSAVLAFLDNVSSMKRKMLGAIQKRLAKRGITITIPEEYLELRLEACGWEEMKDIMESSAA